MEQRVGIEVSIRERAQNDAAFRDALLADPRAALGGELGMVIPDSLSIRVIEEGASEVVLVVPQARPAVAELSDEELETQAGAGWGNYTVGC